MNIITKDPLVKHSIVVMSRKTHGLSMLDAVSAKEKMVCESLIQRPLHNETFFRQARKAKTLTGGIHWVFRGLKFEACRRITGHEVKRQRSYGSYAKVS